MTLIFVAGALLLLAVALGFVLPPLLSRPAGTPAPDTAPDSNLAVLRGQLADLDQEVADGALDADRAAEARLELERRALAETGASPAVAPPTAATATPPRRAALAVGLLLPALAAGLYLWLGTPQGIEVAGAPGDQAHSMEQSVERLAARLKERPADPQAWYMLARSYIALDRLPQAAEAYRQLLKLLPDEPEIMADLADVLAAMREGDFSGEPQQLVDRALALDPEHPKALSLAASSAYTRRDFRAAATMWQKLLPQAEEDDEAAGRIRSLIADAARQGGFAPPTGTAAAAAGQGAAASAAAAPLSVKGRVEVAEALRARLRPDDTLFIFARSGGPQGGPVAAQRHKAGDLPLEFTLDPSSAMGGGTAAGDGSLVIGARISRSGDATARAGDLQGFSAPVARQAKGVRIVIDTVAQAPAR
ncbi:MAG: c-type cytochrome biogenesis protein CcmI [Betaproteobacteria bacterium]|nr:c-type cytochrome biogenesis protein CcmI [Betaproteobacteria bacterium]